MTSPPVVVADLDAEDRFTLGRLVEDQRVALLRIAEAMVVDLVEVVSRRPDATVPGSGNRV